MLEVGAALHSVDFQAMHDKARATDASGRWVIDLVEDDSP